MTKYINTFPAHFFIEMYYIRKPCSGFIYEQRISRENFKLLKESFGIFDGCEELAVEIKNAALKETELGNTTFSFTPSNNVLANKVQCEIVEDNISSFEKRSILKNGKYDPLIISISVTGLSDRAFIGKTMHELTHAYENQQRILYGAESVWDSVNKVGYWKNNPRDFKSYPNIKSIIAQSLYLLTKTEINANVAKIKGLLSTNDRTFSNIKDAFEWIKTTDVYRNYSSLGDVLKLLESITNKEEMANMVGYANELSNYKFKSFDNFLKWFKKKTFVCQRKLSNVIAKIASTTLTTSESLAPQVDFSLAETIKNILEEYKNKKP